MIPRLRSGFRQRAQTPANASTFSCYRRRALFTAASSKRMFELGLERVGCGFGRSVYGYVVMAEHMHLLLSEPQHGTLADALKSLKQGLSPRLVGGARHLRQ